MRKRIFIDTNVMLDLLGERKSFYVPIAKLATLADKKKSNTSGFSYFIRYN